MPSEKPEILVASVCSRILSAGAALLPELRWYGIFSENVPQLTNYKLGRTARFVEFCIRLVKRGKPSFS